MNKIIKLSSIFLIAITSLIFTGCSNPKDNIDKSEEIVSNTNFDELYFDSYEIKNLAKAQIGTKPYNIQMKNIYGENYSIESFKGKKVVIIFGKATCAECIDSVNEINKVEEKNPDIVFLKYYLSDTSNVIKEAYEQSNNELNKYIFSGQDNNLDIKPIIDSYNLVYNPAFYFVNEEGYITLLEVGGVNEETLEGYMSLAYK